MQIDFGFEIVVEIISLYTLRLELNSDWENLKRFFIPRANDLESLLEFLYVDRIFVQIVGRLNF